MSHKEYHRTSEELSNLSTTNAKSPPVEIDHDMAEKLRIMVTRVISFTKTYNELPRTKGIRDGGNEGKLAEFLEQARQQKQNGRLSNEMLQFFDRIPGFGWISKREENLPATYVEGGRQKQKKGESAGMNVEPAGLIFCDGAIYRPAEVTKPSFNDNVAGVIAFIHRHGEMPKQRGQRDGGEEGRLAAFVDHKRQAKKKYKLSAERIKLMETIPKFDWVEFERFPFHVNVAKLREFVTRHGEIPRQTGTRDNGEESTLAKFIGTRRSAKKQGKLSAERIAILESIPGFKWHTHDRQPYEDKVAGVRDFVATYGEMPKQKGTRARGEEGKMFSFIQSQRRYYKSGKLPKDRVDMLETIPDFSWAIVKTPSCDSAGGRNQSGRRGPQDDDDGDEDFDDEDDDNDTFGEGESSDSEIVLPTDFHSHPDKHGSSSVDSDNESSADLLKDIVDPLRVSSYVSCDIDALLENASSSCSSSSSFRAPVTSVVGSSLSGNKKKRNGNGNGKADHGDAKKQASLSAGSKRTTGAAGLGARTHHDRGLLLPTTWSADDSPGGFGGGGGGDVSFRDRFLADNIFDENGICVGVRNGNYSAVDPFVHFAELDAPIGDLAQRAMAGADQRDVLETIIRDLGSTIATHAVAGGPGGAAEYWGHDVAAATAALEAAANFGRQLEFAHAAEMLAEVAQFANVEDPIAFSGLVAEALGLPHNIHQMAQSFAFADPLMRSALSFPHPLARHPPFPDPSLQFLPFLHPSAEFLSQFDNAHFPQLSPFLSTSSSSLSTSASSTCAPIAPNAPEMQQQQPGRNNRHTDERVSQSDRTNSSTSQGNDRRDNKITIAAQSAPIARTSSSPCQQNTGNKSKTGATDSKKRDGAGGKKKRAKAAKAAKASKLKTRAMMATVSAVKTLFPKARAVAASASTAATSLTPRFSPLAPATAKVFSGAKPAIEARSKSAMVSSGKAPLTTANAHKGGAKPDVNYPAPPAASLKAAVKDSKQAATCSNTGKSGKKTKTAPAGDGAARSMAQPDNEIVEHRSTPALLRNSDSGPIRRSGPPPGQHFEMGQSWESGGDTTFSSAAAAAAVAGGSSLYGIPTMAMLEGHMHHAYALAAAQAQAAAAAAAAQIPQFGNPRGLHRTTNGFVADSMATNAREFELGDFGGRFLEQFAGSDVFSHRHPQMTLGLGEQAAFVGYPPFAGFPDLSRDLYAAERARLESQSAWMSAPPLLQGLPPGFLSATSQDRNSNGYRPDLMMPHPLATLYSPMITNQASTSSSVSAAVTGSNSTGNGAFNGAVNGTFNGAVNGTFNGAVNGTSSPANGKRGSNTSHRSREKKA